MKTIKNIIRCPKCEGEGSLKEMQGIPPYQELVQFTCPTCSGSGLVERTIEITDKPHFPYERRSKN